MQLWPCFRTDMHARSNTHKARDRVIDKIKRGRRDIEREREESCPEGDCVRASLPQDGASRAALVLMALILEPMQFLTARRLRRAHEVEDTCRHPPCLDFLSDAYSHVFFVRQYLASLPTGGNPRLMMLWWPAGSDSFGDWRREHPQQLRDVRRGVLVAACVMYRRFTCRLRCYPWRLLLLVDMRFSQAERLRIAEHFCSKVASLVASE